MNVYLLGSLGSSGARNQKERQSKQEAGHLVGIM